MTSLQPYHPNNPENGAPRLVTGLPLRYDDEMESLETLPPELEKFWRTDDGMTACERAAAYGIDLSLLRDNLRLTVAQRLAGNDGVLNESDALRTAFLNTRESTDKSYKSPR